MFEESMKRHPCKYCPKEKRHPGCHDNFRGTGKPCPDHAWATNRNAEIKAEERAEAALNSVLHVPLDEWKERGKKVRTERYRMEGRIK